MRTSFKIRASRTDAIAVLKADHRQVERWFREFDEVKEGVRQRELALQICGALRVHTQIEEEIFYPAYLRATEDVPAHHEAVVEHEGATKLIVEIEQSAPGDEYFDARVHVLAEMIKHHVKEEEKPNGMFAAARKTDADLEALGRQLLVRKRQLTGTAPPSMNRPQAA
jgi:hemerythrin superfamily protein